MATNKKINFNRGKIQSADQWVADRAVANEKMKRFTIDLPEKLHTNIKVKCALDGRHMADVIREILGKNFN